MQILKAKMRISTKWRKITVMKRKLPLILGLLALAAGPLFADALADKYLNPSVCDMVIDKDGYYRICYDKKLKAARAVAYSLRGDRVKKSIKKRPRFYDERSIPRSYRATYSDYTHSGFDRGHLANDASFDWSKTSLNATYSMANIVPQYPNVNRHLWLAAEKFERYVAIKAGTADVLNIVKYTPHPNRIGKDNIAVPSGFYKRISDKKGFERCFYYANTPNPSMKSPLKSHEIDCADLPRP